MFVNIGRSVLYNRLATCVIRPFLSDNVVLAGEFSITRLFVGRVASCQRYKQPHRFQYVVVMVDQAGVEGAAIFALHFASVVHPFNVNISVIRRRAFPPHSRDVITGPKLTLIALQAVRERSFVVAKGPPPNVPVGPIRSVVKALRDAIVFRIVVCCFDGRVFHFRVFVAYRFCVLRSVVEGAEAPKNIIFFAITSVVVHALTVTRVFRVRFHAIILCPFNVACTGHVSHDNFHCIGARPSYRVLARVGRVAIAVLLRSDQFRHFRRFRIKDNVTTRYAVQR